MCTITELKSVRSGKALQVWIDGEQYAEISNECAYYNNFCIGAKIDLAEAKEIFKQDRLDSAVREALGYISRAMRSKAQVIETLNKKGYSDGETTHAVSELIRYGYIDDLEYGKLLLESCINEKKGHYSIKQRLKSKGIDNDMIEELLNSVSEEQQEEAAYALARSKYQSLLDKGDKRSASAKTSQYLSRNGYTWDVINTVLNRLNSGAHYD